MAAWPTEAMTLARRARNSYKLQIELQIRGTTIAGHRSRAI